VHIAQIGTGRVGRPTTYSILNAGLADTITVCDTKPGLAKSFAEELKHVTASTRLNVEINSCDKDEQVAGADIILIAAGKARTPGVKMTRRDLTIENAKIMRAVSEAIAPRNSGAKYIVISNPVDAMGMVCKRYTKADYVISTGTNLESLRFRAKIAQTLGVPISLVEGWVGGEHGDAAIPLWSTTKIGGVKMDEYATSKQIAFSKDEIKSYVKSVSKLIVDNIGATEFGPAASFRDITQAIVKNTNEVFPVAAPSEFAEDLKLVFVGVPRHVGNFIGASIYNYLSKEEQGEIIEAAKVIFQTYQLAIENIE